MIPTVVVGHGLAGRSFHCPLIRRQPGLTLHGIVARDPAVRAEAAGALGEGVRGYASLDEALADPAVAAGGDRDAPRLARRAGRPDARGVAALRGRQGDGAATADADRMIAARDRSGCMLSVFHNRRWDWDFATVKDVLARGGIGRPLSFESAVCRFASPRGWRRQRRGRRHDPVRLGCAPRRPGPPARPRALPAAYAWLSPSPWEGVDSGGHGRIVLEFDDVLFQVETSRVCRIDRPRWWIVGTEGGFVKYGIDPQEDALRAGDIDRATEPPQHEGILRRSDDSDEVVENRVATVRDHWDGYYRNIADHLSAGTPAGGHGRRGPRSRPRARGRDTVVERASGDRRPVGWCVIESSFIPTTSLELQPRAEASGP